MINSKVWVLLFSTIVVAAAVSGGATHALLTDTETLSLSVSANMTPNEPSESAVGGETQPPERHNNCNETIRNTRNSTDSPRNNSISASQIHETGSGIHNCSIANSDGVNITSSGDENKTVTDDLNVSSSESGNGSELNGENTSIIDDKNGTVTGQNTTVLEGGNEMMSDSDNVTNSEEKGTDPDGNIAQKQA